MPLIDLKTNLKSLSYNGNGPYIQKDINNPGSAAAGIIQARVDDTSRILRLLGEKGVAFTSKQALLLAGAKGLGAIPQAAGILANIVAQVPVNGTGTHFLPIGRNVYYTGVDNASSRALAGNQIGGDGTPNTNTQGPFTGVASRISENSKFKDTDFRVTEPSINPVTPRDTSNSELKAKPFRISTHRSFRTKVLDDGTIVQAENRVSLDSKYGFAEAGKSDSINLLGIGQDIDAKNGKDDLVPVIFKLYGNEKSRLVFRGFIQNISDNFAGNWNPVNYIGRMEQFYNYIGFTRTLNFQLVVPIFSVAEQPIVYNKVNSLVSHTAPTYQPKSNLPQGNITDMTLGNYIKSNGILNSVGITIANEVPWSYSSKGEYAGAETRLLPQVLTLSIQFTPIHSKVPQIYLDEHTKGVSSPPYINNSIGTPPA